MTVLRVSYVGNRDDDLEVAVQIAAIPWHWPTWFFILGARAADFAMRDSDEADIAEYAIKLSFGGHVKTLRFW